MANSYIFYLVILAGLSANLLAGFNSTFRLIIFLFFSLEEERCSRSSREKKKKNSLSGEDDPLSRVTLNLFRVISRLQANLQFIVNSSRQVYFGLSGLRT